MKGVKTIFFILALIIMLEGSFLAFKNQMEKKVITMKKLLEKIYKDKCNNANIMSCTYKSYDICKGSGHRSCLEYFPHSSMC